MRSNRSTATKKPTATRAQLLLHQNHEDKNDYGDSAAFDPDKMSNVADIFLALHSCNDYEYCASDSKNRGGGSDIREGILAFSSV